MATELNLSRRPFTNRRPFWAVIIVVLIGCGAAASWISHKKDVTNERIADLKRQLKSQQNLVETIRKSQEQRKEENAKLQISLIEEYQLAQARQMISVKTFSWDKLLSDLEQYIPEHAKLVSLKIGRPEPVEGGMEAAVELGAVSDSAAEMTELMQKFDKSDGMFVVSDVNQGQLDESGHTPFTMKFEYNPWRGSAKTEGSK